MTGEFAALATEASEGRLRITAEVAEACAAECDRYVLVLQDLRQRTADVVNVDSFGALNSAITLGTKFQELAVGGPGSGSLSAALGQHIETVQSMADMFRKAGAAYTATEAGNTTDLSAQAR
ncbi:hypothetical protein [Nocardia jiangsuensis]|uniref:Excreted virulence factor EspC (Type VII ESX diderm) n=1 Tax=Nocardia jiangsuensis TaxID=1691563 RepID=A0ABV8DRH5_9NOCA